MRSSSSGVLVIITVLSFFLSNALYFLLSPLPNNLHSSPLHFLQEFANIVVFQGKGIHYWMKVGSPTFQNPQ